MQEKQILSTSSARRARLAPVRKGSDGPSLVFDACQVSVVLRAVLGVEAVLGAGLLFVTTQPRVWLIDLGMMTSGVLPATLLWLMTGCALKHRLQKRSHLLQLLIGAALGAAAGLFACGMLFMEGMVASAPWLASAVTGAMLAAALVAMLIWRVRGRTPAAVAARLTDLQSRIRPHFLFNTLNSAIALVREDPTRAEILLEDLSDLFRHALTEQGDAVTLEQEVELARRYLEIEQVRFGERLQVEWSIDEKAGRARLPPLILQPLVENAVKHGVEPSATGAKIRVSTQKRGPVAVIKVSNTAPAGRGKSGHGIAQKNVRERLRLLHDMQTSFRIMQGHGEYQARIEVPLPASTKKENQRRSRHAARVDR
ncbi:MAG: histidine kinase [Burkholderiaceae bacterium]|nr:histidine kinase [Burkholderiaceae bacterium]